MPECTKKGNGEMALIYIVEDDKNISEIEAFALKNSRNTVIKFYHPKSFF